MNPFDTVSVTSLTRLYGVLGYPVGHSLSPQMQNAAFTETGVDGIYLAFEVAPDRLGEALKGLRTLGFGGVNVTIPHKVDALGLVDEVDGTAEYLGNVNTIVHKDGILTGHNTDGPGISMALADAGSGFKGARVLCVGAGGVARTVVLQALLDGADSVRIVNRTPGRAEDLVELGVQRGYDRNRLGTVAAMEPGADAPKGLVEAVGSADIVIQTTAAGMHPKPDELPPIPLEPLSEAHTVFELVYRPLDTRFLSEARDRGCRVVDGSTLFVNQGALAFKLWTGMEAPRARMRSVVRSLLSGS